MCCCRRYMSYVVKQGSTLSDAFLSTLGILAGDSASPGLWNLYFSDLCSCVPMGVIMFGNSRLRHGEQKSGIAGGSDVGNTSEQRDPVISHRGKRGTWLLRVPFCESLADDVVSTIAYEACSASFGTCRAPLVRLRPTSIRRGSLLATTTRASAATSALYCICFRPLSVLVALDNRGSRRRGGGAAALEGGSEQRQSGPEHKRGTMAAA